ncbi:acyl-CoA thioesterase [Halobacteriales archaeon QS_8_69_26]|nr:MAG: acyl-CoA thioesterase [Halobacteriales archaeon QS_8_69_26]
MTEFAFTTEFDVRYRDLDPLEHVNNAVYATYLETARLEYLTAVLGRSLATGESVLAHLSLDFRRSVTFEDSVTVAVGVTDVGGSSIRMEYEIRAGGEVAATAETVLVTVEDGDPTPVPGDWRTAIEEFEGGVD